MLTTEVKGGSGDETASLKRPGLFVFCLPSLSDSVSRSWTLPPSVQQLLRWIHGLRRVSAVLTVTRFTPEAAALL